MVLVAAAVIDQNSEKRGAIRDRVVGGVMFVLRNMQNCPELHAIPRMAPTYLEVQCALNLKLGSSHMR
jgi:hypothetical protein